MVELMERESYEEFAGRLAERFAVETIVDGPLGCLELRLVGLSGQEEEIAKAVREFYATEGYQMKPDCNSIFTKGDDIRAVNILPYFEGVRVQFLLCQDK